MNIYEMDNRIAEILDGKVNEETGEIEIDTEELEALCQKREELCEYVCLAQKNDMALIEAKKKEIALQKEQIEKLEKRVDRRNDYLFYISGGQKFVTPRVSLTFRTTKDVVSFDISDTQFKNLAIENHWDNFLKVSPSYALSKTAIKRALQDGVEVPHARLIDSVSATIK